MSEVTIGQHGGDNVLVYRVPTGAIPFGSRRLNWQNLVYAYDGPIPLERVADGLKPVGQAGCVLPEHRRRAVEIAKEAKLPYAVMDTPDHWEAPNSEVVCVAAHGRIGDVFDLDALGTSYRILLERAGSAGARALEEIGRELARLKGQRLSHYLNWLEIEGPDDDPAPNVWVRRGLLWGYPVESTAAVILNTLGLREYGCFSPDRAP